MTATQSVGRREKIAGEGPSVTVGVDRRRGWLSTALIAGLAAVLGFGAGWLVFDDTDTVVSDTVEFPTGRFVNKYAVDRSFDFNPDGTFLYSESSGPLGDVSGVYGGSGDLYVEMTHDFQGYEEGPAMYRWTFDGEELIFEQVGSDLYWPPVGSDGNTTYVRDD